MPQGSACKQQMHSLSTPCCMQLLRNTVRMGGCRGCTHVSPAHQLIGYTCVKPVLNLCHVQWRVRWDPALRK